MEQGRAESSLHHNWYEIVADTGNIYHTRAASPEHALFVSELAFAERGDDFISDMGLCILELDEEARQQAEIVFWRTTRENVVCKRYVQPIDDTSTEPIHLKEIPRCEGQQKIEFPIKSMVSIG